VVTGDAADRAGQNALLPRRRLIQIKTHMSKRQGGSEGCGYEVEGYEGYD
jgi:hypothetical protein